MVVVLGVAFFAPALVDGHSFGGFDIAAGRFSALGAGLYPSIHSFHDADAVSQMVSWNALDWTLLHQGHLPLWNDYSVLGMPQLANFESSVFSLPDLVSYLVPLHDAFLVAVMAKLVLAGTGTYLFTRVLGARPLAATFAGVSFMLSGAFVNWVTWPLSDVYAWAGWLCGLAVLVYRSPARPLRLAGLALAVAFSIYGGFPEANFLLGLGVAIAAVVFGATLLAKRRRISPTGLAGLAASGVLGLLLAAPLLLPGLQVLAGSHRQSEQAFVGLPLRTTSLFLAQGYFGMPIGATTSFSLSKWNYFETVAYVGVVAIALALLALFTAWRRPVVLALSVATLATLALSYQPHLLPSLQALLDHLSIFRLVRLGRERTTTAFFVSVLAGLGLERLLAGVTSRWTRVAFAAATALVASGVGYLVVDSVEAHLSGPDAIARHDSLIWPLALVATLAVGAVVLGVAGRRAGPAATATRVVALGLVVAQAAFLYSAGVGIPTYSKSFYPTTAAERTLQAIVGNGLVGLDTGKPLVLQRSAAVGLYPNVNIGYHIRLFAVHDPLTPAAYYSSWPGPAPKPNGGPGLFVPDVDTLDLARHYGIGWVLAVPGLPAPAGMQLVTVLDGEALYRVPEAAQFSFLSGGGRVLSVDEPYAGSFTLSVETPVRATLVLRVTAVAGWHLSVDGRPTALSSYDGVLQSARLGPGRHRLRFWYWPSRFGEGLRLALAAGAVLTLWFLEPLVTRRRRRRLDALAGGARLAHPSGTPPPATAAPDATR